MDWLTCLLTSTEWVSTTWDQKKRTRREGRWHGRAVTTHILGSSADLRPIERGNSTPELLAVSSPHLSNQRLPYPFTGYLTPFLFILTAPVSFLKFCFNGWIYSIELLWTQVSRLTENKICLFLMPKNLALRPWRRKSYTRMSQKAN